LRITVGLILSLLTGASAWGQQTIPVSIFSRGNVAIPAFTNGNFKGSLKGNVVRISSVTSDPGPRRVVLLLDVSGSMLGSTTDADWIFPLDIAEILLVKMPPAVEVGLAVFATELDHVVAPTTDRKKLRDELEAVRKSRSEFGDRDTAVWDAIVAGAKLFERSRVGDALYLITDGIDNKSSKSSEDAVQALACRGIRLFPFVLADRRKTDRTIKPASFKAQLQMMEMATDTGGLLAIAPRPSSADHRKWEFVDNAGNPTGLTASLFAQYQQILNVYRISIDLPERLNKPQGWHLDFDGIDRTARNNLTLVYPQKLATCQ
jgi:hypothetical protein